MHRDDISLVLNRVCSEPTRLANGSRQLHFVDCGILPMTFEGSVEHVSLAVETPSGNAAKAAMLQRSLDSLKMAMSSRRPPRAIFSVLLRPISPLLATGMDTSNPGACRNFAWSASEDSRQTGVFRTITYRPKCLRTAPS